MAGSIEKSFSQPDSVDADCRDTFANFPFSGVESNERGGGGEGGLEAAHSPTANSKDQPT